MRTTVTIEPDLVARIRELSRTRGISFKAAFNSTLRAGLEAGPGPARPYREKTRDLGAHPDVTLIKALQLAATLEDEETIRQLELRK